LCYNLSNEILSGGGYLKINYRNFLIKYLPLLSAAAGVVVILFRNPLIWCLYQFKYLARCPFNKYTELLCPGCGNTRSVIRLLSGDILGSLKANITPIFLLMFFTLFCIEILVNNCGKKLSLIPRSKLFYIPLLVLFSVYFVLRNLPAFSFMHI
jgi:hypothetical protein